MSSFAPFFYRNILVKDGGPIKEILVSKAIITKTNNGFEAACSLSDAIKENFPIETNYIYGNPDGSGSDVYKSQAIYKAISEAIERWAFFSIANTKIGAQYGFNLDSSTNGMAAFPSFFYRNVKEIAYLESLERWALSEWWSGNLSATFGKDKQTCYIQICFNSDIVVICWQDISDTKPIKAYGFAAGKSFKAAYEKAQIELFRNTFVLDNFYKRSDYIKITKFDLEIYERRLLWFASQDGFNSFLEKVHYSSKLKVHQSIPKIIVNKEIKGPWSKYAKVWRCLIESRVGYNQSRNIDQFMF